MPITLQPRVVTVKKRPTVRVIGFSRTRVPSRSYRRQSCPTRHEPAWLPVSSLRLLCEVGVKLHGVLRQRDLIIPAVTDIQALVVLRCSSQSPLVSGCGCLRRTHQSDRSKALNMPPSLPPLVNDHCYLMLCLPGSSSWILIFWLLHGRGFHSH